MVLLRIALERRFKTPFATLMHQRLTGRLAMSSTALPLPRALVSRAVQGYGPYGRPIGEPGGEQGTLDWPGAGQVYSSLRDMAVFLTANLGELTEHRPLQEAMALAQQGVFSVNPRFTQGLAQLSQLRGIFGDFWGVEQAKDELNQAPLISERL